MKLHSIITRTALVALLAAPLAGCGSSQSDRAISGGGIGAGAGALGSAALGGNPWTGAAIGAGAGAATGALTDQNDIDLGKPAWK